MKRKPLCTNLVLFCCSFLFLLGCQNKSTASIQETLFIFDTVVQIELFGTDNSEYMEEAIRMCQEYEAKFSRTIDSSEISMINHANGDPVVVSDDTIELIEKGLYYCKISDGAFDITIAPLSTLWDFKNNTGTLPSQETIDTILPHIDYSLVKIEGNTVTLADKDAAIDLGAIAKGYIADQLKAYFLSVGIEHGIINLGGNVLTIGTKIDGSDYNIGIQRPFDEQNSAITSISISDKSIVSSGVYERYFELDGQIYHHILDPTSGYPVENNLLGVTIVSPNSVDGDGLSTTCFALGLEKGMELIDTMEDVYALFIDSDYNLHYSYDFPK